MFYGVIFLIPFWRYFWSHIPSSAGFVL